MCDCQRQASAAAKPPTAVARGVELAKWALPSALLAVMPKCPACVAAYVALATGLGLSLQVAWFVRSLLVVLCVASLSYLAVRRMGRIARCASASQ